jgi:hypothetical protein
VRRMILFTERSLQAAVADLLCRDRGGLHSRRRHQILWRGPAVKQAVSSTHSSLRDGRNWGTDSWTPGQARACPGDPPDTKHKSQAIGFLSWTFFMASA